MNKFILLSLFIVFQLVTQELKAQDTSQQQYWSAGLKAYKGFFLTNKPKAAYIRDSYSELAEISMSRQTNGTRDWQIFNNYPRLGMSVIFGNTGSKQYMGAMAALFPWVDFKLLETKRSRAGFRIGTGLAWIEKPFNKETNPKNLLIGSHLNCYINLELSFEQMLSKNIALQAGLSFHHVSNGIMRLPNLGINIPAVSVGFRYNYYDAIKYRHLSIENPLYQRKLSWRVLSFAAIKEAYWINSGSYLVNTINIETSKQFSSYGKFDLGFVLSYDRSLRKEIGNLPELTFSNIETRVQAGAYIGYEHVLGKFSIPVQLGVYVFNKYPEYTFFQNLELRYQLSRHWLVATGLKSHFGKADNIHWGAGYTF